MKTKLALLGSAVLLCGAANAADLSGFTGLITGGYTYSNVENIDLDTYDIGGMLNYAIPSTSFNVQGGFNYDRVAVQGENANTWTGNGAVYWRGHDGAAGVFGNYNNLDFMHNSVDYGSYGVFGEWYAADAFTVRANGGGLTGQGENGAFIGTGATYYVLPQLSLKLDTSYATFSTIHMTNFSAGAEYLPFKDVPVTLSVAYIYADYRVKGTSMDTNGVMFKLAYHFGASGSLAELDRNGPVDVHNQTITPFGK